MSMAMSRALAKPSASVPPWLFTTTPFEAEEDAAIGGARIELAAQHVERAAGDEAADAAQKRAPQRAAQEMRDQLGGAFGGLERDIAGEAVGHDDVDRAFGDIVAFDEAGELDRQRGIVAQDVRRALHRVVALHVFGADIENADGRPLEAQDGAREGLAHHREIDQLLGADDDVRADVEHHALAALGRPQRRDGGTRNAFERAELEHRHRHQRAGVAGGDRDFGFLVLHRFDGAPHAGVAAAAQRQARLFLHAHPLGGVADRDAFGELAALVEQRLQLALVAMQDELHRRMAQHRTRQRGHDDAGPGVAAHRVNRDGQIAGQARLAATVRSSAADQSGFGLGDFAAVIMAAGAAHMVGTLLLAAIGALIVGGRLQGVMRPAHVAPDGEVFLLGTAMAGHSYKRDQPKWPSGSASGRATIQLPHRGAGGETRGGGSRKSH